MSSCRFEDYIDFLRTNIKNVIEYREATGTSEPRLHDIMEGLFNKDPFIVVGASVQASKIFDEQNLYH